MKFDVLWTETALRQLKKLDRATSKKIIDHVEQTRPDPFRSLKKLESVPLSSLRVGLYRVILSLERSKLIILDVEHRKKVYRKY